MLDAGCSMLDAVMRNKLGFYHFCDKDLVFDSPCPDFNSPDL